MPYKISEGQDASTNAKPRLNTESHHRALVDWLPMSEVRLLPDYLWFGDSGSWIWENGTLRGDNVTVSFSEKDGAVATVSLEDDPMTFKWQTKLRPVDIAAILLSAADYEEEPPQPAPKRQRSAGRVMNTGVAP